MARRIRQRWYVLPSVVMAIAAAVAAIGGPPRGWVTVAQDEAHHQSPAEAHQADLLSTAEANGWTLKEAQTSFEATEAVNRVSTKIYKRYPERWIGSKVSLDPNGAPTLFVKGKATDAIEELVASEDIDIIIADDQPYSFDELEDRKTRVHDALLKAGYDEVATKVNITGGGVIPAGVRRTDGMQNDKDSVLAVIPQDLRSDVRLTVHDESLFGEDHAMGGQKTTYTGDNSFCTSGWTVKNINQTTGVLGAAHCTPMNRISGSNHTMSQLGRRYGAYGDVVWWSTNTTEEPSFYAESDEVRNVYGAIDDIGDVSINQTLCMWGRKSLVRNCSAKVDDKSISCGVLTNMLLMNKDVGNPGDSGGPWFYDNVAYGSHHGWCSDNHPQDAFTPTWNFDNALGVGVLLWD